MCSIFATKTTCLIYCNDYCAASDVFQLRLNRCAPSLLQRLLAVTVALVLAEKDGQLAGESSQNTRCYICHFWNINAHENWFSIATINCLCYFSDFVCMYAFNVPYNQDKHMN